MDQIEENKPTQDDDGIPADLLDENFEGKTEPEAEAPAEPEKLEAKETKAEPEQSIPYARFKEVNEKLKAEREAAQAARDELNRLRGIAEALQRQQQAPAPAPAPATPQVSLKELKKQRDAAILDGELDKAAELDDQIDEIKFAKFRQEAQQMVEAASSKAKQETVAERLANTAAQLEKEYPILDAKNPDRDDELIEAVLARRNQLVVEKKADPVDALLKSVEFFKKRGLLGAAPAPAENPQAFANAQAASRQPPRTSAIGTTGSKTIDINNIKPEDWAKIPDDERARYLV